jgi:hypothetical protein
MVQPCHRSNKRVGHGYLNPASPSASQQALHLLRTVLATQEARIADASRT